MKSVTESLEALYEAFRDVPKPRTIEGCPCCIGQSGSRALLSSPLRDLTGTELASYAASALLTVGEAADYFYFLPRILEISCTEDGWWPDVEITGRAIGATNPAGWSQGRRAALADFLHAVLADAIKAEAGWMIDRWVCAIAKMRLEVAPFLDQLGREPKALLSYYERNSGPLVKQKLGNAFWEAEEEGYQTVVAWFGSSGISRAITEAYGLALGGDK